MPFQQRSSLAELMASFSLHSVPGRLIQAFPRDPAYAHSSIYGNASVRERHFGAYQRSMGCILVVASVFSDGANGAFPLGSRLFHRQIEKDSFGREYFDMGREYA